MLKFEGRENGREQQLKNRNLRSPGGLVIQGKLEGKESAAQSWNESPVFRTLALFHCDHLPKGERIDCAKFKEAVSKWFRLSAYVFLEVQKTESPARAVPGNKFSGVCRR